MEQPVHFRTPSIAPSDMAFYTGQSFPGWYGNLFIGALATTHLSRLMISGERVEHEERLLADRGWRVRLVEQGPDGLLCIGVDHGAIYRITPQERPAASLSSDGH